MIYIIKKRRIFYETNIEESSNTYNIYSLFISSAITPVYVNMIIGGIIGYVLGRMD